MCDRLYHCDINGHAECRVFIEKPNNFICLKKGGTMDIGSKVRQVLNEKGIKVTEFADAIGCSRENAHRILSRSHMDTDLLERISEKLGYDFFAWMSRNTFRHSDTKHHSKKKK